MKTAWARVSAEVKVSKGSQVEFCSDLGAAIKRERSGLGISQDELAKRSGLHRTYVSDLERGTRNPTVGSIQKIANALQLPVGKLFEIADKDSDQA
jgi:transcriptional regulator with XRE-family HTH domain